MGEPTLSQRTPNIFLKYESDATRNFNWEKIDDTFRQLLHLLGNVGGGFMPVTNLPITGTGSALLHNVAKVVATLNLDPSAANHTMLLLGTINILSGGTSVDPWDMKIEVGPAGGAAYLSTLAASVALPKHEGEVTPILIPICAAFEIPVTPVPISVTLTKTTGDDATTTLIVGQGHVVAVIL